VKVQERKLENATVELTVDVEADIIEKEFDKVYKDIQKTAKIDGFRKGKVPFEVVKQRFQANAEQQVVENIVKDNYFKALQEKKVMPINHPKFDFDQLKPGETFSFKAVVEVAPTVELSSYTGIAVEENQCKVKTEDIDFEIDAMREQKAEITKKEADDAKVEKEDKVVIKVTRTDNAKNDEPVDGYNHSVVAGKSKEDYDFDKYVVGMSANEEKEVKVKYPKTYHVKDLSGEKAVYNIKVVEINNRKLPELNDEFAKEIGDYSSLEDLKTKTKDNLDKYVEEKGRGDAKAKILQNIIDNSTFDIPKSLIEQEKHSMFQRMQQRMGFPIDDMEKFASVMGMNKEDFSAKLEDDASQSIKSTLVLSEVVKKEEIKVTDEMYNEALTRISKRANQTEAEISKQIEESGARKNIESEIMFDKAMDLLYDKASVKKLSPVSVKEFMAMK
jgi:trigger factor